MWRMIKIANNISYIHKSSEGNKTWFLPLREPTIWCESVRQATCMAHPGAFRLNDSVRAKRLTPLPVRALLEADEGYSGNRKPNQGGTA